MKSATEIDLPGAIDFETGSTKIIMNAHSKKVLGIITAVMRDNPDISTLSIEGNTDNAGEDKGFDNKKLSRERSQSVADYLASVGIDAGRMRVEGFGSTNPRFPNDTPAHMANNRRVEFHVLGFKGVSIAKPAPPTGKVAAAAPAVAAAAPAPETAGVASQINDWKYTIFSYSRAYLIPGTTRTFTCAPEPAGNNWTEVYGGTDDNYGSNTRLCMGAVHAGKITRQKGGTFTVVYKGKAAARGSKGVTMNGVSAKDYANDDMWGYSPSAPSVPTLDWTSTSSSKYMFSHIFFSEPPEGETKTVMCPPLTDGSLKPYFLQGTGEYTTSTGVCWAALHAGKITRNGGTITIVAHAPTVHTPAVYDDYGSPHRKVKGSTQNGLTSKDSDAIETYSFR